MLKWIILAAFVAGLTVGTMTAGSAKSRGGCDLFGSTNTDNSNSSTDNTNSDGAANDNADGTNDNADGGSNDNADGTSNDNASDGTNQNDNGSSANDNTNENTGGGNSNANENSSGAFTMSGRFAGTLTGTSVQTLNGSQSGTFSRTLSSSVQFDASYVPPVLPLLEYAASAKLDLTSVTTGTSQTFNYTDGSGPVTLGAQIQSASYLGDQMHLSSNLTFNSTSSNLTRTGTGTQTVDGTLDASGNLVFTIHTVYNVHLAAGSFSFDTTDTIDLTGTLTRQ